MKIHNKRYIFLALAVAYLFSFPTGCKKNHEHTTDNRGISGWNTGSVFYDANKWTQAIVGNMPLVISVPHGGSLSPSGLPDRTCDDIVTVTDGNTIPLAEEISDDLFEQFNVRPYLIFCHLKRIKIDQNRSLEESACGHQQLEEPWHNFHNYIDTAIRDAVKKYGKVLYIDLHGHGHPNQRLELGYGLGTDELGSIFLNNGLSTYWKESTLQNLSVIKSGNDFREFLTGENSFGTLIADNGFNAVPSQQDPYPLSSEAFFNGGYNSRYYTDSKYPSVFGFQIEAPYSFRHERMDDFASAFTKSVMAYLNSATQYKP